MMSNTPFKPELPLSAIGALALGQRLQAIKIVRDETALDLTTAQELVEAYERKYPDIHPEPAMGQNESALWLWLSTLLVMTSVVSFVIWFLLEQS